VDGVVGKALMSARVANEKARAPAADRVSLPEEIQGDVTAPVGTIQTLRRGVQILEMVISSGTPVRLAEVARRFDMDRASAFRFLQTLEYDGLVAKDTRNKSYSVGGRLVHWSAEISGNVGVVKMARPYLEELVRETGESGHFGMLTNSQALLLDYIGSKGMVVVQNRAGVFEPLYCTALGKALLAFQPVDRQKELISGISFRSFTERTIATRSGLERALEKVRREAVAHDNAEYHEVLYCIASPVIGLGGLPLGAIGVSMVHPLAIKRPEKIRRVTEIVRAVARDLTAALGDEATAASVFGLHVATDGVEKRRPRRGP
jgi:DNA-binding IclR family transcriptional regulator